MNDRRAITSSDGGVESKAGRFGRCPLEDASGIVAEGGQNATTGKDALADIAQAVKLAQPAASDRRISEQPETAYSADRQIAGVAPGPSETRPSSRAEPAGWQLVPKKATQEMMHAGGNARWAGLHSAHIYEAMLEVAPKYEDGQ